MNFHRPTDLAQALEIRAQTGAKILAGGTDIYPALSGPELVEEVLDITVIPELKQIYETSEGWHIGATCTWAQVANASFPSGFAALQQAARKVGSQQIQNTGTIGGNLCNASPAADGVPPLLVLDAQAEIGSSQGNRRVSLDKFILGVRKVDLRESELLVGLFIPHKSTQGGAAFEKIGARKHLIISISMVAVRLEVYAGKITCAAISVGASSPVAKRIFDLEKLLIGLNFNEISHIKALISKQVKLSLEPIDDIRANATYRDIAAIELIERALRRAFMVAVS